jgi:hypothetical protein
MRKSDMKTIVCLPCFIPWLLSLRGEVSSLLSRVTGVHVTACKTHRYANYIPGSKNRDAKVALVSTFATGCVVVTRPTSDLLIKPLQPSDQPIIDCMIARQPRVSMLHKHYGLHDFSGHGTRLYFILLHFCLQHHEQRPLCTNPSELLS